MRKRSLIIGALTLVASLASINFHLKKEQQNTEKYILNILHEIGFTQIKVEAAQKNNNHLILKNISLDPEGFSTIREIRITPNWLPFFGTPAIKNIELIDLNLAGEIDSDFNLTIAGLRTPQFNQSLIENILVSAEKVKLQNARLSLLSENLGGLDIRLEAGLRQTAPHTVQISADFLSQQRALALNIYSTGTIQTDDGAWEIQMQTEQSRLDSETLSIKRLYGQVTTAGHHWAPLYVSGQLTAGQLELYGNSAQNVSATLEYKNNAVKIIAEGKSGQPTEKHNTPLEFSMLYSNTKPDQMQITIYTPSTASLLNYFGIPEQKAMQYKIWPQIKNLSNYNILMPWPLAPEKAGKEFERPFLITQTGESEKIWGSAQFQRKEQEKSFILKSAKPKP